MQMIGFITVLLSILVSTGIADYTLIREGDNMRKDKLICEVLRELHCQFIYGNKTNYGHLYSGSIERKLKLIKRMGTEDGEEIRLYAGAGKDYLAAQFRGSNILSAQYIHGGDSSTCKEWLCNYVLNYKGNMEDLPIFLHIFPYYGLNVTKGYAYFADGSSILVVCSDMGDGVKWSVKLIDKAPDNMMQRLNENN